MAPTPGHSKADGLRYRTFVPFASILRCFRCHSTPLRIGAGGSIEPSEPGVHCESCHGPGAAHIASHGAAGAILNPARLKAGELNVLCGVCHRKPPEAGEETDWSNSWNTRHQPRLSEPFQLISQEQWSPLVFTFGTNSAQALKVREYLNKTQ